MSISLNYVRDSIINILRSAGHEDLNGVLACYNAKDSNQADGNISMSMSVLPLYRDKIFPNTNNNKDTYLKIADNIFNLERPNEKIFHKDHFYNTYKDNKGGHFHLYIDEKSIVTYDKKNISIGNCKYKIDEYFKKLADEQEKPNPNYTFINSIDQCYFGSGCSQLLIIPIPLLSTPVFLLVIDASGFDNNQKTYLIKEVYNLSKITVRHFILTNLIDGLKNELSKDIENIKTEYDLIVRFKNELCKILLPIEWEIGEVYEEIEAIPPPIKAGSIPCNNCGNNCDKNKKNSINTREKNDCINTRYLYDADNSKKIVRVCNIISGNYVSNWPNYYNENDDEDDLKSENIYYFHFFISIKNEDSNNKKYIICLAQTSFKFPFKELYVWIQKLPEYDTAASQLGTMLSSIFNLIYSQWKEIQKVKTHATRAAISQVMARNTSHNIGAHVMNKLIGELNFDTLFKKKNYGSTELTTLYSETIKKWKDERTKDKKPVLTDEERNQKILLDQISIFNNYIKCRMDYLADISFGTPMMQTNKYAYGELFTELDKVRLLLEHISGLDSWSFKIEFKKNGSPLSNEEDILVAIPNDLLGIQAFNNITENIIRNTAKHSKKKEGNEPTIFTVNFIDDISGLADSEYCGKSNCVDYKCIKAHKTEIENTLKEFIAVEIYNDITEKDIDELVINLNQKLNDDILHENKLRSSALGLIEMEASAAYLRKRPVEYINHPSYEIQYDESWSRNTERNGNNQDIRGTNCRHFLKAFKKSVTVIGGSTSEEHYLGYRFFLHRPAIGLVVTEKLKQNKDLRDILQKKGILVLEPNNFREQLVNGKVFPHEFVVYSETENVMTKELIKDYKTSLSTRTLDLTMIELDELLKFKCPDSKQLLEEWEVFCWNKWGNELKTIYSKTKICIDSSSDCKKDDCQCTINENDFNAVIVDHGKEFYLDYKKCKNIQYLDNLSTKAFEKLPQIKNLSDNNWACYKKELNSNSIQRFKIYESILSKILVIDERVQNQINEPYHDGILFHEFYSRMGIIIPEIPKNSSFENNNDFEKQKFNLAANDLRSFGENLRKYITYYSEKFKKTDSILIHYGILERVYNDEPDKAKHINTFLKDISLADGPQIIITSGRGGGALTELTTKVRFVNLSSVITSFVDIKSKYFSNYLLKSARKNNSKN